MSVISEEELREIVEVVCMTVLDLPVDPGNAKELASSRFLTADIAITGAWEGSVSMRASEQFLAHAAALMFSCEQKNITDMERSDTLTELTNMLGGTVKCLLPETCDLSLPTVQPEDYVGKHKRAWVSFSCADKPLAVAVTQSAADSQQAA